MTNLQLTIKNIERIVKELPLLIEASNDIKKDFDVEDYVIHENSNIVGRSLDVFNLSDSMCDCDFSFDYLSFIKTNLPSLYNGDESNVVWSYLFNDNWFKCHPTFEDFIQRCKNLLDYYYENSELPKAFDFITMKIKE